MAPPTKSERNVYFFVQYTVPGDDTCCIQFFRRYGDCKRWVKRMPKYLKLNKIWKEVEYRQRIADGSTKQLTEEATVLFENIWLK